MQELLKQEQFEDWLESPVTEIFLKYLKDSAKEEAELVAQTISNGGSMNEIEQTRIGTICVTLTSISDIDLEEITDFYNTEE